MTEDRSLSYMVDLVRRAGEQRRLVTQLEAELVKARAILQALEEKRLPEALAEVGMVPPTRSIISGLPVVLDAKYRCGQLEWPLSPAASRRRADSITTSPHDPRAAIEWFDAEYPAIPRRQIVASFGKDSFEAAEELFQAIKTHRCANQASIRLSRVIPWNVLAAFAKEQIDQGYDPPLELLGVRRVVRARVGVAKMEKEE